MKAKVECQTHCNTLQDNGFKFLFETFQFLVRVLQCNMNRFIMKCINNVHK